MKLTQEQLAKAKAAKSAEELLAIAKEAGIEITADQVNKYFAELNKEGELTDNELASVAGGKGDDEEKKEDPPTYYGYPIRSSGWKVCEDMEGKYSTCGSCKYFDYQAGGESVGGCNGYCTKGF